MVEPVLAPGAEALRKSLSAIQERIDRAARDAGRQPQEVRLMAVTKTLPRQVVDSVIACGLSLFGENRVQEAEEKFLDLTESVELHLIGHLQRNKARAASGLFRCVQSIDKLETAQALETRLSDRGRAMDVLLELNTSGEPSKSGFLAPDELLRCLEEILRMPHLRPRGLMTVGPLTEDAGRVRSSFAQLRQLFDRVRSGGGPDGFDTLSMGMSADFETAIAEGATLVRVGTALFGPRGPA
ncbi:MAG TPA: YggS family pyridoxal phosphate-dependent enzyme [Spirochaetia bacterium]|nr:YggS family pyridoxal phosphate-dependent enzyme [Spirochaetia bacterium]